MDEKSINKIINKYKNFRLRLEEHIKSKVIKIKNNDDCYLINDSWDNILNDFIRSSDSSKKYKKYNLPFVLQGKNPEFINDISIFIDYIKKKKNFKLISKEIIDLIDKNFDLKLNLYQNTIVYYFTGNNKLIIEFKGRNKNGAILINYPLKYTQKYFIKIGKDERANLDLYKEILSNEEFGPKKRMILIIL